MNSSSSNQSINLDEDNGLKNSKSGQGLGRRPIQTCKMPRFRDAGKICVDHEEKIRSEKMNPEISRELLVDAVIKHDLPFSFVEYDGIRTWMKYINPDAPYISRNILVSDITEMHTKEKEKLKKVLAKIQNRICLTFDAWTTCTSERYICLSGQFVDENWKLNSKILCVDAMPHPHSGVDMAIKVYEILREWGIEKKVFSLTLDKSSSNDCMQNILKERLSWQDRLLCEGEFFHVRCSAQILNHIVQEGLKVVDLALQKIRESVKYVKGTEDRMKQFKECVSSFRNIDTNIGLRLDVSTCWSSTYLMLDRAIKYKLAFLDLQLSDGEYREYELCPSTQEWKRVEKICEFLEPFYDMTNLIAGSSYPTSNLYFMYVWKIEVMLIENLSNEDVLISDMCRRMKEEFDKYWSQYSKVLALGAVLDPRIKLSFLDYFYSKVESDPIKCQETISLVKTKLHMLFEHYANATKPSSSQPQSSSIIHLSMQSGGGIKSKGKRLFDEMLAYESQIITNAGKSQLDLYLEDPKLEFSYYEDLDVMEYWKKHEHRYPTLALMARDVLAIPITTVAAESTFSTGARVLTKYRSCTLPEKVQALICTRNWLHGYVIDNEESPSTKIASFSEGSNELDIIDEDDHE